MNAWQAIDTPKQFAAVFVSGSLLLPMPLGRRWCSCSTRSTPHNSQIPNVRASTARLTFASNPLTG